MKLPSLNSLSTGIHHSFSTAFQGLMRNKLLTVATVLIISLMLFVFNLILALNFATESVIDTVGEKLDISVEFLPQAEDYTIRTFISQVKQKPQVKQVIYIPKEEALKNFGFKYPNVITFLDHYKLENPLPNVLRIVTRDVNYNNEMITYLEDSVFAQIIDQQKISTDLEQKNRNQKIVDITLFIQRISLSLSLVFALVGLMIVFNSININIHHHRNEIQIMKLVGAKYNFIRSGFIVEGMLLGFFSLIISLIFSRFLLAYLANNLLGLLTNETLVAGVNAILFHFDQRFEIIFLWQFVGTLLATALSSYLAIELYLRKNN